MVFLQGPEEETKPVGDSYPLPSPGTLTVREVAAQILRLSRNSLIVLLQQYKIFAEISKLPQSRTL